MAVTWTGDRTANLGTWCMVGWNGSVLVVVPNSNAAFEYSTDLGLTWTSLPDTTPNNPYRSIVALADGTFVNFNTVEICTSPDGTTWTNVAYPAAFDPYFFAASNGEVAFCTEDDLTSTRFMTYDGTTVTERAVPTVGDWYVMAAVPNGGNLVALSYDTTDVVYSDDNGVTWNTATASFAGSWNYAAASPDNVIIAIAWASGSATRSLDGGATWATITMPATTDWAVIEHLNGTWVALTDAGAGYSSTDDGDSWTTDTMPSATDWSAIAVAPEENLIIAISRANPASLDNVAWATIDPPPVTVVELTSTATATDSMAVPEFIKLLASDANATESLSTLLAKALHDQATASATLVTTGSFVRSLLDTAEASESLRAALLMVLSDTATASETFTEIQQRFGVLVDRVLATDGLVSTLDAVALVTSAALASDLLSPSFAAYLADNANASDVLAARLEAVTSLLDIASATDTLTDRLSLLVVLSDTAEASDSLTSVAALIGFLESGADASVVLTIGGEQYTAWVLNTENIAVSQYTNYPFNSFAELPDGRWYGAADDGLYLLDGDDDAGTAIQAYFRAPLTDFGFASLKRLPEVYIGYTAGGDLVFKAVVVSPNGVKEEHWYQLADRPAAGVLGTRETSVPVGKGLKSVYWQFEIHNIDGADFQIDAVRLWPMGLTRRVR